MSPLSTTPAKLVANTSAQPTLTTQTKKVNAEHRESDELTGGNVQEVRFAIPRSLREAIQTAASDSLVPLKWSRTGIHRDREM